MSAKNLQHVTWDHQPCGDNAIEQHPNPTIDRRRCTNCGALVPTDALLTVHVGETKDDEPLVPLDLARWWVAQARDEAPEIARKAKEYGSNSLAAEGAMLKSIGGGVFDASDLELGCFVYAYGKIQRALDAYQRGEKPSRDTWVDVAVYAKMVLRIRDVGTWPGQLT